MKAFRARSEEAGLIYTLEIVEAGQVIYSHDILLEVGFDFGRQISDALDTFRKSFGRGVFDPGLSLSIKKKP